MGFLVCCLVLTFCSARSRTEAITFGCIPMASSVASQMLTINGVQVSVGKALKQPGHVLCGDVVNVAPDGRCPASTIVAALNVSTCLTTHRTEAGYAEIIHDVQREERQAREWLEGIGAVAETHGKTHYVERLMAVAGGACAEADDFQIYSKAIRHCIVVQPAEKGAPVHIFGKPKWPTGVWVKQVYLNGKGHYQLVQSWLPQTPTMSPPSPLSRPGSSKHMFPRQCSESQESVPVVPTPSSRVEAQRRRKRAASSVDVPDAKRHKVSHGDAVGALSIAMANARNAVAAEETAVTKFPKRSAEYKRRSAALDQAKQDIARIVKAPKASAEQRVPKDHREREKRNTFGSKTETNLCNED